jgi:hypothetical protein
MAVSGLGAAFALVAASLASPNEFLPGGVGLAASWERNLSGEGSNSSVSGSHTVSRVTRGGRGTGGGGDE